MNMKQKEIEIDLRKIKGDGEFDCPNCGARIDPEDESDKVFTIEEPKVVDEQLVELSLKCKCGALIVLTGFEPIE